ncbi:Chromatin assembly factor 1 subunit [Malassezia equina]|uniref:Chromatin assembly factor 1 subunit n=1 Tax=Malassezia equina TaxID=1381935 RepID=A0AAF0IXT4_9BASI|nr:Chromatin assembly factor 1 subunit [Malassezia equina]
MVRCVTFEIRWHDTLPIYSCDFQPISSSRLTNVLDHNLGQGGDNNVRMWMIHPNIPSPAALAASSSASPHPPRAEYTSTLTRHTGVVNVVRFSPSGEILASAGDDGAVLFWVRSNQTQQAFGESHLNSADPDSQYDKESWRVRLMTRATTQELYDMTWSPDGDMLAVGGTDFAVRLIQTSTGAVLREVSDHSHYIQGVAWDPLNLFLATQSSDRSVHIHHLVRNANNEKVDLSQASKNQRTDMRIVHASKPHDETSRDDAESSKQKSNLPTISPASEKQVSDQQPDSGDHTHKMYGDDRCSSFFRRLAFSPDGALLATPTGQYIAAVPHANDVTKTSSVSTGSVYMYARASFGRSHAPIAVLPGHKTVTLIVRFSPILYHLRDTPEGANKASVFALPYRMVYAVATQDSVWVYDTQQAGPICCFSNLHYASFTDLAWSPDGQVLMMSSSDGYCSTAVFDYHELGQPYNYEKQPSLQRTNQTSVEPVMPIPTPEKDALPTMEDASAHATSTASVRSAPETSPTAKKSEPKKKRRVALKFEGPIPPS